VQIILQHDAKFNRHTVSGGDFYLYHKTGECWYSMDYVGLIDFLAHKFNEIGAVLIGRWVPNAVYNVMAEHASIDPDFLPQSIGAPDIKR